MKSFILLSVFFIGLQSFAETRQLSSSPEKGSVKFEAVGRPSMVKIRGEAKGPTTTFIFNKNKLSGEATFALDELDTKIQMRNDHMKNKYLETTKYPKAILKFSELTLPETWSFENTPLRDFPFTGVLSLHGVDKEIAGTLSVTSDLKVQAYFELKVTDFKIDTPSYLGITMAEVVKVTVHMEGFTK